MPIYRRGGSGSSGLPTIETGDAGKVLTVKADESGVEFQTPSTGGTDEAAVLSLLDFLGH